MALTLDQAAETALKAFRAKAQESKTSRPLWPAPYDQDTAEAGYRWLTECWWTLNEADQSVCLIPCKRFVREFVEEWHRAFSDRQPFVCEKARRMVVSWMCRGLETWQMGLKRGEWLIVDQTHANAAEHLWRVHFCLEQLRDRRPDLGIPKHETRGSIVTKEPTHVILANGSILTQAHQEAGAAQGKGKTGVTLEEVSKYRNPAAFWSQAIIVTQGSAAGKGGWVSGICNASPNVSWHEIKGGVRAREVLGLE